MNVPTSLKNLKTKVDDLDVGKLKTVPIDLKKLGDVVDNEVVENTKRNTLKTKVNSLEKKISDATKLIHMNKYNTDKQNLEKKIGDVDKKYQIQVTTTVLNTKKKEVENKIPNTSNLVTTNVLNRKINEGDNKIPNRDKYITTPKFNKLTAESFVARLKQANLVTKTDFNNKLTGFRKRITLSKTKHLEVQKKLNSLITNDYNFFLGRNCFTCNGGFQSTFVYRPTLDTLELKKALITFLVGNQREYLILNLNHYILLSQIA